MEISQSADITLITPTRNRPRQFSLLEKYIARQTYEGPVQWVVVVDGGIEGYNFTMGQKVISRDTSQDIPKVHSICYNYLAALPHITGSRIFCIEDDDWYAPIYLDDYNLYLDEADLVGTAPAIYINLAHRWYSVRNNKDTCSLAQTAFTSRVLPTFEQVCRIGDPFIDMTLWVHWPNIGGSAKIWPNEGIHVGLKGWGGEWGELGIGTGHAHRGGQPDENWTMLRHYLGRDAENYIP